MVCWDVQSYCRVKRVGEQGVGAARCWLSIWKKKGYIMYHKKEQSCPLGTRGQRIRKTENGTEAHNNGRNPYRMVQRVMDREDRKKSTGRWFKFSPASRQPCASRRGMGRAGAPGPSTAQAPKGKGFPCSAGPWRVHCPMHPA